MCCGEVFYLSCDDVIAYGAAIAANFPALTLSFLIAISRVPSPPFPINAHKHLRSSTRFCCELLPAEGRFGRLLDLPVVQEVVSMSKTVASAETSSQARLSELVVTIMTMLRDVRTIS